MDEGLTGKMKGPHPGGSPRWAAMVRGGVGEHLSSYSLVSVHPFCQGHRWISCTEGLERRIEGEGFCSSETPGGQIYLLKCRFQGPTHRDSDTVGLEQGLVCENSLMILLKYPDSETGLYICA